MSIHLCGSCAYWDNTKADHPSYGGCLIRNDYPKDTEEACSHFEDSHEKQWIAECAKLRQECDALKRERDLWHIGLTGDDMPEAIRTLAKERDEARHDIMQLMCDERDYQTALLQTVKEIEAAQVRGELARNERDEARKRLAEMAERVKRMEAALDSPDLLESLAALSHESWTGWVKWMFKNWSQIHSSGETFKAGWRRHMATAYADLTEREQESDRAEARKQLAVIRAALAKPGEAVIRAALARPGEEVPDA